VLTVSLASTTVTERVLALELESATKLKISLALKNHPSLTNSEKKYKPIILMDKDKNIIKTYKGVTIA
jgi:hypothetical protein